MSIELDGFTIGKIPSSLPRVNRIDELVGNTPMVRLSRTGTGDNPIYVKMENTNPSGSMRDRYIAEILERAMNAGQLMAGDHIAMAGIDDSAVAGSFLSSVLGLSLRVFAPENSSRRLVPIIERFGAEVVWVDGALENAVLEAAKWARKSADRMYVDGYRRSAVTESYEAVAAEILESLGTLQLGAFVTSVTTGATFRHVSSTLRASQPQLEVRGARLVENEFATAEENPFIIQVTLEEIWKLRDEVAQRDGILLGPKGAACVRLALKLQGTLKPGRAIVALNPDAGQRYLGWEDRSLFKA